MLVCVIHTGDIAREITVPLLMEEKNRGSGIESSGPGEKKVKVQSCFLVVASLATGSAAVYYYSS